MMMINETNPSLASPTYRQLEMHTNSTWCIQIAMWKILYRMPWIQIRLVLSIDDVDQSDTRRQLPTFTA